MLKKLIGYCPSLIVNKIDTLNTKDLKNLSNLFSEISDNEIFLILTKKAQVPNKYQTLINKLLKFNKSNGESYAK